MTCLLRHPGLLLAAVLALALFAVAPIGSLRFDSDINRVFLSDTALSEAQRDFEERFDTTLSDVAVLVESRTRLSETQMVAARALALDYELTPGVVAVVSPFSLRFPPGRTQWPKEPVIPARIDRSELSDRLAAFRALDTGLPTLFTTDTLLILASIDTRERLLGDALPELRSLAESVEETGASVTITGQDVVGLAVRDGLAKDLLRLNLVGAALVLLAAMALLRDPRLVAVAIGPPLLGAVGTLGLAAWLGLPITVLSNVIPMLMLVIGVANGLHLAVSLARAEGQIAARVETTLREVGPASALTAATTALAFAAIMVTGNTQLFEFALLGTLGVALTFALLLPGFAALALLLAPKRRAIGRRITRASVWIGTCSTGWPRGMATAGLGLLSITGIGFATTQPWFPLYRNLPAESPLAAANDRIAERFGGVFRVWVEMPEDADWSALGRTVRAVEKVAPEGSVLSELDLARWLGTPETAPSPDAIERLPRPVTDRLRDPESGILRFAVDMPEPMRSDASLALFDRVEDAALDTGAARLIGLPAVMRHGSVALIRELSLGLVLASAGGALAVAVAFRSLGQLGLVLVVNLLPVLLVGAAPHLFAAGHMTPPVALALSVAFGIAIDDTIHFLTRYRTALAAGRSGPDARNDALRQAGGVMSMTTLLLCLGLAVTAFSVFHPVQVFGLSLALSLVAALLVDLVILPAFLIFGDPDDPT